MSHNYITNILNNKSIVDSNTSSDFDKSIAWAESHSMAGDLIVIREGYLGSDGIVDIDITKEPITSWYRD